MMEITNEIDDNETESDVIDDDDDLTESSEQIFLQNLSKIIADSERTSANESLLSIAEVKSITNQPQNQQPQFGYFLPISYAPPIRLRSKRDTQHESSRSPTPLTQPNHNHHQQYSSNNVNNHINGRSKRFSSPAYSDYGCDKVNSRKLSGKHEKRSIRSMNEAIEVLADQVEEENLVSKNS
ncbi:hypothetical protein PVAND_002240 [Polypedilum vanderplanki]|uniref:Uncharacterized protein n=1 Tax=Polypedilum vanderplanki TaxID=319348 RepID=A0A9J6BQZ9_POLVA|nr:hypothetical protein PVAND_002240 [Polypedilum vanderplanki]